MGQTDILKTEFTFPRKAYIVGSGMSAKEFYRRIPPGAFVIACNRAIELPIKPSIWLVHDPDVLKKDWFNNRISKIVTEKRDLSVKAIRAGGEVVPVFESEHFGKTFPAISVVFKTGGDLYRPLDKADGVLSTRATVAGIALALCYFGGCKEVTMLGVDMRGGYFTGEPHPQAGLDKVWPCLAEWEWLVKWVKSQGVDVRRIDECDPPPIEPQKEIEPAELITISPDDLSVDLRLTFTKGTQPVVSVLPQSSRQLNNPPEPRDATGQSPDPQELPTVGYLCMSFDPIDKLNAVFDFEQQDWPVDKKILYLLHQRDSWGQFPGPTFNNSGLKIVDVNCEGFPWPEMWTFKFVQYLKACTTRYTLWWDEDDRYPSDYTRKAMQPILDGLGRLAWSWDCIVAEYVIANGRYEYRDDWYRSPIACMAIETDLLRKYSDRLWAILYTGTLPMESVKRKGGIPYGGAQDDQLRQMIQHDMDPIPHHRGKKMYTVTSLANSAQLRSKGNSLNYSGKRGTEDERTAQPTRFDYDRSGNR